MNEVDIKEIILKSLRDLYVDDTTNSFNGINEAFDFYKVTKTKLLSGNFELRKWATNNNELQLKINKEESINDDNGKIRKVLGIDWDTLDDKFSFDFQQILQAARNLKPTKRNVLKIIGMFFDPLGLIAPIALQPKLLFKKLCLEKFDWDSKLPADHVNVWNKLNELSSLEKISTDRHVLCKCGNKFVQLHGFCDSSAESYCACVYARVVCDHGVSLKLWASKSRLTPVKSHSIPRLELLSCLLLSNLILSVK